MPKLLSVKLIQKNPTHAIVQIKIKGLIFEKDKFVTAHKELTENNTFGWIRTDEGYLSYDNNKTLTAFIS